MTTPRLPDIRRSAIFSTLGGLFRFAVNLLAIPILIHGLGLERYGVWSVLLAVVNIALALRPGWNEGLTHFLASARALEDSPQAGRLLCTSLAFTFAWGGLLAGTLTLASGLLTRAVFPTPTGVNVEALPGLLTVLAIAVWARMLQQWAIAAQAGLMRFDVSAGLESVLGALLTLGLMVLAVLGYDLLALGAWTVGVALFSAAVHLAMVYRTAGARAADIRFDLAAAGRLSSYGLLSAISNVGSVLFAQGDRVLVSAFLGSAGAGLYAAVTSVAAKINELVALPLQALPPAVSGAMARGDHERVATLYGRAFHLNGFLVWVLASGLTLLARPIGLVLVGPQAEHLFASALVLVTLLYALYCLNGPSYYVTLGTGRVGVSAIATVLGGALTLLVMALLMPSWGVLGASFGNIGFLSTWLITWVVVHSLMPRSQFLKRDIIKQCGSLGIVAVFGVLIVAVPEWYPLSMAVAVIGVTAMALTLFRDDLRYIISTASHLLERLLQTIRPSTVL